MCFSHLFGMLQGAMKGKTTAQFPCITSNILGSHNIHVTGGHWHPFKLIFSHLHAGLSLARSVATVSHPSVTTRHLHLSTSNQEKIVPVQDYIIDRSLLSQVKSTHLGLSCFIFLTFLLKTLPEPTSQHRQGWTAGQLIAFQSAALW